MRDQQALRIRRIASGAHLSILILVSISIGKQGVLATAAHKTPAPVAGPPWSGGNPPQTPTCKLSQQPACLTCPGGVCTACTYSLGNARFVLNKQLKRCECPPGFGIIPAGVSAGLCRTFHVPWLPAADVQAEVAAALATAAGAAGAAAENVDVLGSSSSSGSGSGSGSGSLVFPMPPSPIAAPADTAAAAAVPGAREAAAAAAVDEEAAAAAAGLKRHLLQVPTWATQCLPCPPDWYSPGGQIGIAQCLPCPLGYGTGDVCASPNCLIPKTCNAGKAPNLRTGTCRLCPYGTFQPYNGYSGRCLPCPDGFTTQKTGAVSEEECYVPICPPGTELDDSFLWCNNCTGMTISLGGATENGAWQPPCTECPYPSVPNLNRTQCFENICPPPDAFSITCTDTAPSCGPNANPVFLPPYCTILPRGSKVTWYRGNVDDSSVPDLSNPVIPAVARCPSAAEGSNYFYPYITSFRGRSDCFCVDGATNCAFNGTDDDTSDPSGWSHATTATDLTAQRVIVPDPQLTSLRAVLTAMDPSRSIFANGTWDNLFNGGGYCNTSRFNYDESYIVISCTASKIVTELMVYGQGTSFPTGTLPGVNAFANLPSLRVFGCDNCASLKGSFPQDWGLSNTLINLQKLNFSSPNSITGSLPDAWGNLVNLQSMILASINRTNGFTGPIPPRWGNMNRLQYVDISKLQLSNSACAPNSWRTVNGLIPNVTFLYPSNIGKITPGSNISLPTSPFCL